MSRRDIVTAVPTSFHRDGTLDPDGTRSIFRFVAQSGNEGAFVLGTTGEFPSLDEAEFEQVVRIAIQELADRMRVIVHVGQPSAYQALRLIRIARSLGATEFAALTPYYLSVTDEGVYDYFAQLSDAVEDGALYVYNYPKRSGFHVSPELLTRLSELPAVVGVKASELTLDDIAAYRAAVADEFIIYTGADKDLVAAGEVGAQGVVSGVSSVMPAPFRELARAADSGDAARIAAAQAVVDDICEVIGGNMSRMKAAYRMMGVADGVCRMSLDTPDDHALAEVRRVLETYS